MRVDAHQHFWHFVPERYPWISADMAPLRRDRLPEHLAPELAAHGVDACIAVQARHDEAETRELLAHARAHPFVRGVVGWTDLRASDVRERLAELADDPLLVGLRHIAQDEPDDRFLLRPDFEHGIAALAPHGFVYDLLVYPRQLPAATELVRRHPRQPFVLDHLAKPEIRAGAIEPWAAQLFALAAHDNVVCKVSGLVTEAAWHDWSDADLAPYLDAALAAFGPERLLFGSDWPVCLLAARDYGAVLGAVERWAAPLSEAERAALLGGNAVRVYGLELEGLEHDGHDGLDAAAAARRGEGGAR